MQKKIYSRWIWLMMAALLLAACHEESDDYYTTAEIMVTESDSVSIIKMQGTVKATNLANKQVYSTSTFEGNKASMEVMRGAYSVLIEGTMAYRDENGVRRVATFRASTDYCEMMAHPAVIALKPLFM